QLLLHLGGELRQREGLGEEGEGLARIEIALEGIVWITGHENDLDIRPLLPELIQHARPVHLGHDYVADDEIDLPADLLALLEPLRARRRLDHVVALTLQRADREAAHGLLILDEQHAPAAREITRLLLLRRLLRSLDV